MIGRSPFLRRNRYSREFPYYRVSVICELENVFKVTKMLFNGFLCFQSIPGLCRSTTLFTIKRNKEDQVIAITKAYFSTRNLKQMFIIRTATTRSTWSIDNVDRKIYSKFVQWFPFLPIYTWFMQVKYLGQKNELR